jgi:hypothetical protein
MIGKAHSTSYEKFDLFKDSHKTPESGLHNSACPMRDSKLYEIILALHWTLK